jgi:hypothetical protein
MTPTPTPTATPVCGDGLIVGPAETCDPPTAPAPNGGDCRVDCTYCGDGVTQASDNESCDDGNTVSGCRLDKPQKALDGCLNSCQRPICDDPARIQLNDEAATGKHDVVQVHARLITEIPFDFAAQPFELEISRRLCSTDPSKACSSDANCGAGVCTDRVCAHDNAVLCAADATCDALSPGSTCSGVSEASIVFRQELEGIPLGNLLRWRYRDVTAKQNGGIWFVKVQSKMEPARCAGGANNDRVCTPNGDTCPDGACVGYYQFKLKAYGDAERAVQDMQTRIIIGGQRWAVRGVWTSYPNAWKLNQKSPLLEPWP